MEYAAEFVKYITNYGKLEIIKVRSGYIMKCLDIQVKGANIETALMLLIMRLKKNI